jgi:hypothetical protein
VIANEVLFLGGKPDSSQERRRNPVDYPEASGSGGPAPPAATVDDDDIPF